MSYSKAKFVDMIDKAWTMFSWGLIDNVQPHRISYKNTPSAQNFRIFGDWIFIRPWYYQFWVSLWWTWINPFGIWSYIRSTHTNDRIIVWYKDDATHYLVSVEESWTQTPILTDSNITVQTRMNFVTANDSLYCMNWTNWLWKLTWTTYTVANALTVSFWIYFNGSLWIAWNPSAPTKLYKSITDTPWTFTWGDSDDFTFPEVLTWIAWSNTVVYVFWENTLSYFNSQTIRDVWWSLVYSTMPLDTNWGLTNPNCVVAVWKHVYYLSKANKIKRVAPWQWPQWFDVEDLTHRLNRWIEIIMDWLDTDQSNAFCYYDQDNEIIKWHVKSKWSTLNDLVVSYSTMFDEFFLDTNKSFFWWVYHKKKSYTISQVEDKIYLDEQWQTDDGVPIQFEYWTKHIDEWMPYIMKELWQTRLFLSINSLAVIKQEIYADWWLIDTVTINSDDIPIDIDWIWTLGIWTYWIWEDWDASEDKMYNITIIREKGSLQVRAKYFQVKYSCSSSWGKCTLMNFLPRLEVLSELTFEQN